MDSIVLQNFPWDDSKPFVQRSAPAAVFLQNGRTDKPIPERIVRRELSRISRKIR